MADFSIRPMRDDDLDDVLDLMRWSLGETDTLLRTPQLFRWKHVDNPFGRSILLVAEADDRIVGLRAFMRWELVDERGSRLRCVRAVDTATHPDYQRRGIFAALTEEAVSVARAEGVDLVFNTPNPRSGAGYLKMGWVTVGAIGVLLRPRMSRSWFTRDGPADVATVLPAETPVDPESLPGSRAPIGLRTPRDLGYLRWRFASHPTVRYAAHQEGSTAVLAHPRLRNGRTEVVVSDLLGEAASAPIRRLIRSARAAYAAAWFSAHSPERRAAAGAGLLPVPRVTALTLVARPLRRLDTDVTSLRSWDFALSDLELL